MRYNSCVRSAKRNFTAGFPSESTNDSGKLHAIEGYLASTYLFSHMAILSTADTGNSQSNLRVHMKLLDQDVHSWVQKDGTVQPFLFS